MSMQANPAIYQHLASHFDLPLAQLGQVGTHISEDNSREATASQVMWTLADMVIIRTHPSYISHFEALIQGDTPLSISDIAKALPVTVLEQDKFYTITAADFKPTDSNYPIRALSQNDKSAFEAFLAHCSERDKAYGEVSLDDEAVFGAFDGARIISVASSYEWYGFVDIGVLTDPNYRGQGMGKAVSSAITQHYLEQGEGRPLLWRHETSNIGSGKIAKNLGWQHFATLDYIRFEEAERP